jgi:ribosomal protein S18 acetylase RimI-like enzyme
MTDAERIREAMRTTFESVYSAFDDARYERRDGYDLLLVPQIPVAQFNAVWPFDDEAATELEGALAEIESAGLASSVQVRKDQSPAWEAEAERLGLTKRLEMPTMVVREPGLRARAVEGLAIEAVAGDADRMLVAETAAAGFGAPLSIFEPIYSENVLALEGLRAYVARAGDEVVSTSIGYTTGDMVGIFNVATPPDHRGRGYGAAVTAAAARGGFADGAELAWLQSSEIGLSVYRGLGFEQVTTDVLLTR